MMRRLGMTTLAVLLLSAVWVSALRADDPTPPKKPDPKDDSSQWVTTGILLGQLTAVDQDARTFTLKVTQRNPVVNQSAVNDRQHLLQQLSDTSKIKDPTQRQNKINDLRNQLAKNEQSLIKIEEKSQDIQMQAHDEMKVRTLIPPPVFDDKGNPRKYTPEELADLKDSTTLPGYRAAFGDVQTKQYIQVAIGQKKTDSPSKPPSPPQDPKDTKDPPRLTVIVLVIVGKPE
jgi:TolA-binding protein